MCHVKIYLGEEMNRPADLDDLHCDICIDTDATDENRRTNGNGLMDSYGWLISFWPKIISTAQLQFKIVTTISGNNSDYIEHRR